MKFTWTAADIISGRYVCVAPTEKPKNADDFQSLAMKTCKIGYNNGVIYLVAMTDGAIMAPGSKESLATHLNEGGYMPMPHKWLCEIIEAMRDWYEGV